MIRRVAAIHDLPFAVRAFLKTYPWRRIDPVPWAPLRKPLAEANVALITTAGLSAPGQEPFDDHARGGDYSFRTIDRDADVQSLIDSHRSKSFDHTAMRADVNLAFPLDRMRELERDRVIGRFNQRAFSFMGSITAPGRLVRETAPEVAGMLAADGADAALLVPV